MQLIEPMPKLQLDSHCNIFWETSGIGNQRSGSHLRGSSHLFPLCLCDCVPIVIPAIFLCCLVVVVCDRSTFIEISSSQWRLMTVRSEMGLEGLVGWSSAERGASGTADHHRRWCCRFCSETNVWTRSKCRRCQTGIPSVSTKSGSWTASSSSGGELLAKPGERDRVAGVA